MRATLSAGGGQRCQQPFRLALGDGSQTMVVRSTRRPTGARRGVLVNGQLPLASRGAAVRVQPILAIELGLILSRLGIHQRIGSLAKGLPGGERETLAW
jgi:hypothetical protein